MSLRSSGTCCAVRGCTNNQTKLNRWLQEQCFEHAPRTKRECCCETRYTFHRLPRDEEPRRRWLKNLNLKRPPKTLYVCSFHFVDKKPTEEHPHPTLWLGHDKSPARRRRVLKRPDSSVTRTSDEQDEMDQGEELCAAAKSSCDAQTQCGTGVFYQALPAVGADGKNIMKLIPVQMVNGQFVQSQISQPKKDPTPQKAVTINSASATVHMIKKSNLNPPAAQQCVRKQVSLSALPNQAGLDLCNSPNKHPLQQQNVNLMAIVPPMATPATNREKSGRLPGPLPVTVKSPALPRGQCLQIPPNAQVRTVPASELPPAVKTHIFTSSASSCLNSGLPSVVYVSPATTVNVSAAPQSDSALHSLELLCKASNKTSSPPSKGPKPHLKLIQKASQRPNSPIKWVIEEEESAAAPAVDPINSSVASEILRVVAERESATKQCDVTKKTVCQSSQGKSGQGLENTMVMCNGKVFFVAKNCSLPQKIGKSDSPSAAGKSYEFNKTSISSPERKQHPGIIAPRESDEVIDLCDDDAHDDSTQQAASVHTPAAAARPDEDNVIFVSYIPPKSESAQDLGPKAQMAPVRETDQTSTRSSDSATEPKSLNGTTDDDSRMESSVNPATSGTSSPAPASCHMADNLLRQMFGITASVKICLQRIDGASVWSLPAKPRLSESVRSEEDHQEETNLYSPQETDGGLLSVQRARVLPSEDSAAQSPHTDSGPLKCPHSKLNTKPLPVPKNKRHSGNTSLNGASCDVETEPAIGYMEPIDEDFLSTDENDIPNSQDAAARPQPQSCADLNANTRRMGRTRKRTTCPCCIPGTQGPAAKSSAKAEEAERWAWTTEQTNKRGGRRKAARKDVKTSGRISCLTARKKSSCEAYDEAPASDSLSTADSDELKRYEEIKRLKALLKEKEAALELMRNSPS